jgi:GT2 family glycosyltransferase
MTAPDLSICIVNWNTRDDLQQALASIPNPDPGVSTQVIVVDNASQDGSARMVRERFPAVRLIESGENLGFARGYNRAVTESAGRYLLILNPDTIVHDSALTTLTRYMDDHPQVGAGGPRLLNSDGSLQYSCRRFPTPIAALFRNTLLGKLLGPDRFTRLEN